LLLFKKLNKNGRKKKMNNRGQMGMGLITGMFTAVFVFVMLSAFLPVIVQMLGTTKGNDSANCIGYSDQYATTALGGGNNKSYNSDLATDAITCSIIDFTPGMLVMSIVFAIISGIITGRLSMSSQEQQPSYQYQQY
jgi:hypothetical protein